MDKIFLDFIIYSAFNILLIHSDKEYLSVMDIHNYRLCILKQMMKYFEQFDGFDDEEFESLLKDYINSSFELCIVDEVNLIKEFLVEHKEIFGFDNGVIYLKKDIDPEELNDIKFELDSYNQEYGKNICGHMISFFDSEESLKVLGATKIVDDIRKIKQVEDGIESCFNDYSDTELQNTIRFGNLLAASMVKKISKNNHMYLNSYYRMILNMVGREVDDFTLGLLSNDLKVNDEFYENNNYIDYEINNSFLQALFGTNSLVWEKLKSYFELLEESKRPLYDGPLFEPADGDWDSFFEKFSDEDDEISSDDEFDDTVYDEYFFLDEVDDDEFARYKYQLNYKFYMLLLNNINCYLKNNPNNEELLLSKKRLMYLLNQYGIEVFDDNKFDLIVKKISFEDLNYKRDLYDFYTIARLFLIDILEYNNNDNMLKKILFVFNYFDITNDIRIKRILNKYKKTDKGKNIFNAIINGDWDGVNNGDNGISFKISR